MQEPSPHNSRIVLAGAFAAIIVVGGGGFLLGRGTTERETVVVAPAPIPTVTPAPAPEPERGVLGRADLIALAATAADAAAGGSDAASRVAEADGRRFEISLPFGCGGPASEDSTAPMRWTYNADDRALRLNVAPVAWTPDQWWSADAPAAIDTIEGFWIMRPWTASEACPESGRVAALGTEAVTLPGQTLALGQVFASDAARDGRRDGKPYQAVVRVAEDALDTSQGFHLRLSGRIARVPGGSAARCQQPAGPEQRPICLIGMVLDEVAIENPANDETLATWTVAQRSAPDS